MVFAENPQGFLSLDQSEKIICNRLTIEEVIHTEQKVPEERGKSDPAFQYKS